ncbi:MAG: NAD(P)H-hydrate dehydratase [Verrucomicrobiales bacterium]|nr:NAD(P)H-hydrate dehydratase [Verrucomicrobiales bacterium]
MMATCRAIQQAESRLFASGVAAEPLMERAGRGCAAAIGQWHPEPGRAVLFVGKGNNGGDALVIGRELRRRGWEVEARYAAEPEAMTPLARQKRVEFENAAVSSPSAPVLSGRLVLVDGLLGIGARGPLEGRLAELAAEMNALRRDRHGRTFAVDVPSGLDGDTGEPYPGAVEADVTLTISAVKAGLIADAALDHVGRLVWVPLPEIAAAIEDPDATRMVTEPAWLAARLPRRDFSCHKGRAGRVAIVAGSRGLSGAASLCARGALRGGAGLVTVFVPEAIYPVVASAAPAEAMVVPFRDWAQVRDFPADVIAVGPGLGAEPEDPTGLEAAFWDESRPLVVDADALNWLSRSAAAASGRVPAGPRLLTPHPGEMARWRGAGALEGRSRAEIAAAFVKDWPVTLLFKGARTIVAEAGRPLAFNPTGQPGMATGGIGDVLTGLCAALIGQGLSPYEAAVMGSWLIGRSAEAQALAGQSEESLLAGDVAAGLGAAFEALRTGTW